MLPLALKTKTALILITAAIASSGTIAGLMLARHATTTSAAGIPLPANQPTATPVYPSSDNTQALLGPTPTAYSPTPVAPGGVPMASPAPQGGAPVQVMGLSSDQLNQLLGPIALYSDPLIAEMLPASTYPDQLAAAALWLRGNPTPPEAIIQAQPWEPSIKGLAHSPSVLIWMYSNPDWTRTLGTAFAYQPQDVMNAIQSLRAMALANGSLGDSPQQVIVMEDQMICVEPAMTDVVYVPVYDWRECYVRRVEPTFFVGAHIGPWFDGDCDWDDHFVTFGASWDMGWAHRWDHDRDAHPVIVRNAHDGAGRNGQPNTVINNTTIINNQTVKVGGTPWQRNGARPAPSLPQSVNPGGHDIRQNQPRQPIVTPDQGRPDRPTVTPATPEGHSVTPVAPDNRGAGPGRGNPGRGPDGNPGNGRGNPGRDNRG